MAAGGKGSARRPTDEAAWGAGYDATFGRKADQAWVDSQRAENLRRVDTLYTQANNGPGMYSLQPIAGARNDSP